MEECCKAEADDRVGGESEGSILDSIEEKRKNLQSRNLNFMRMRINDYIVKVLKTPKSVLQSSDMPDINEFNNFEYSAFII